jgi:hypothetical protein
MAEKPRTTKICAVSGCEKPVRTAGLCVAHYSRWYRGKPLEGPLRLVGVPVQQRFDSKVRRGAPDECWPWLGATSPKGYGVLQLGTAVESDTRFAHRLAWEYANGPIPEGQRVLHRCDNPPCCNPGHLFLGTDTDNQRDKVEKGRQAKGQDLPQTVLTPADVRAIRRSLAAGQTQELIGLRYGVSRATIGQIKRGETWRHVV